MKPQLPFRAYDRGSPPPGASFYNEVLAEIQRNSGGISGGTGEEGPAGQVVAQSMPWEDQGNCQPFMARLTSRYSPGGGLALYHFKRVVESTFSSMVGDAYIDDPFTVTDDTTNGIYFAFEVNNAVDVPTEADGTNMGAVVELKPSGFQRAFYFEWQSMSSGTMAGMTLSNTTLTGTTTYAAGTTSFLNVTNNYTGGSISLGTGVTLTIAGPTTATGVINFSTTATFNMAALMTVTNIINFGTSGSAATPPAGVLKIPLLTAAGPPTYPASDAAYSLVGSTTGDLYLSNGVSWGNVAAGSGANKILFRHYVNAGNTGTGETTLYSDTIAANQLSSNGQVLTVRYGGFFFASATATKAIRLYWGATELYDTLDLTYAITEGWSIDLELIRAGTTTLRYRVIFNAGVTRNADVDTDIYTAEIGSQDFTTTNALAIKAQAGGVGAATNDIVAQLGYVEFKP